MLHTQVSKVMQVKKQNKKICFSLVSALALLPYTSTTQVQKKQQQKNSQNPQISVLFVKSLYEQACLISLK